MVLFSFRQVNVRGAGGILFENLELSLQTGQHLAITGLSGSGKTALLEMLAGKLAITGGEITHPAFDALLPERQIDDPLFSWHKLVVMISSRHHFRNRSHRADFYYQQRFNAADAEDADSVSEFLQGIRPCRSAPVWTFDRVVARLRLNALLDKPLIMLSNGETKRLLFAAALLKNPLLLLLDQPLTGLDADTRADFDLLFTEIADSGIHIVMATHPAVMPSVITHAVVLENRRVAKVIARSGADFPGLELPEHADEIDTELLRTLFPSADNRFETIAAFNNVTVRYGEKVILHNLSWTIARGERWALLGPNGSGKSTLLSLVNGDNPQAYANDIVLFDRRRGTGESIWDIKKNIGFVSPELFQYFPAASNCLHVIESGFYDTLGLFRKSDPAKADTARRWMTLLGIGDFAGQRFRAVPASAQRLCLLARALVKHPPLLIFDEPCQGLDDRQQAHFRSIVDAICGETEVTLIYVSHYAGEIPRSVNRTFRLPR